MSLQDTVQVFLGDFKEKARVFDIFIYPRQVNSDALLDLGITSKMREEYIMNLTYEDYFRGPTPDTTSGMPEYFEFGIELNNIVVYIKLSLGKFDKSPCCMSFHRATSPIVNPLKGTSHGNQ
jgi:hypothetical protein